jgi:hypothetical protein
MTRAGARSKLRWPLRWIAPMPAPPEPQVASAGFAIDGGGVVDATATA